MTIVVVGPESLRLGFRSAGAEFITVENSQETLERIEGVRFRRDVGLLLVVSTMAKSIRQELDHMRASQSLPLILEIPDLAESTIVGSELLGSVSRAMGFSHFAS